MIWIYIAGIALLIAIDVPLLRKIKQKGDKRTLFVYAAITGILAIWVIFFSFGKPLEGPMERFIRLFNDTFGLTMKNW